MSCPKKQDTRPTNRLQALKRIGNTMSLPAQLSQAHPLTDWLTRNFHASDYDTLAPGQWIADAVIDFHSAFLSHHFIPVSPTRIKILAVSVAQMLVESGRLIATETPAAQARARYLFDEAFGVEPGPAAFAHIFIPINTSHAATLVPGGIHWSLVHIHMTHNATAKVLHAYHYDPSEGFNDPLALSVVEAFCENTSLSGTLTAIGRDHAPRDKTGYECGLFVTWMMRMLVNRVCAGQWELALGVADTSQCGSRDDDGRAVWFVSGSLQCCFAERSHVRGLVERYWAGGVE
jgi:hypothetical protein